MLTDAELLTGAEREALYVLSEECAEVQQAVSKVLRFGPNSSFPEGATVNSEKLAVEMAHVKAAIRLVCIRLNIDHLDTYESQKLANYVAGEYLAFPLR